MCVLLFGWCFWCWCKSLSARTTFTHSGLASKFMQMSALFSLLVALVIVVVVFIAVAIVAERHLALAIVVDIFTCFLAALFVFFCFPFAPCNYFCSTFRELVKLFLIFPYTWQGVPYSLLLTFAPPFPSPVSHSSRLTKIALSWNQRQQFRVARPEELPKLIGTILCVFSVVGCVAVVAVLDLCSHVW